jgi:hypothetical protein
MRMLAVMLKAMAGMNSRDSMRRPMDMPARALTAPPGRLAVMA